MITINADLHIHSKYSKATSNLMDIENIVISAKEKGITLLSTGDFTHPLWLKEIKEKLDFENGIGKYKNVYFILGCEVSNVFEKNKKTYKVHNLIFSESIEEVLQINEAFSKYGNLKEDGRPTLNCSVEEMVEILKSISKNIGIVPAHIWTPWFSLFGSNFGCDDIKEIFSDTSMLIALETGLSSDPLMNWMVSKIDKYTLISNSDAHSLYNIGREANKLKVKELSYKEIIEGIKNGEAILKTYEFFPQEGKYYNDGHRKCNVSMSYEDAEKINNICPVCKKKLTKGVMHRIKTLSDRDYGEKRPNFKPFQHIIQLKHVIAKLKNKKPESKEVNDIYRKIILHFGNELAVYEASDKDLYVYLDKEIAEAIIKIKNDKIRWKPGYDGVYGEFILNGNEQKTLKRWYDEV